MTDTRDDPRYVRTIALTLVAALLVVASCEVERPPPTAATTVPLQTDPPAVQEQLPAIEEVAPTVQEEPPVGDEVRAAIEALRAANRPEPPAAQAELPAAQAEPQEIPAEDAAAIQEGPVFTPMTVRPEITNRAEVQAALMREYPPALRDLGIGGTVVVWFYLSDAGQVLHGRISESSGNERLDEAALRVAAVLRFTPAMNRDERVPVWIQLPVTFQVN